VPCPHCEREQELQFARLKWQTRHVWERVDPETGEVLAAAPDETGAVERDTGELLDVWYECEACDQHIPEHYKTQMLERGRWIAHNAGPDRVAGFKLNALYSPIGWFTWRKVVLAWLRAEKDTSGQLKKTFTNTVLGEAYEEPGETVDEHYLKRRIEPWAVGETIPAGALILCAGCDVQGNRLEIRVWGYGRNQETWLVDRHILFGAPSQDEVWTALERLLDKSWPHALGGTLRIAQMAIDASDGNTTHFVRAFARRWLPTRRVIAVKGQSVQGKALLGKPTEQDVSWRGQIIKNGVQLWPMGSDTGKAAFYARLRVDEPGPGFVHLPSGLPEEEFQQMTAERKVTRYIRGHAKVEWHLPAGRRNEALDCRVMADAAAERYGVRSAPWDTIEASLRSARQGDLLTQPPPAAAAPDSPETDESASPPEPPVPAAAAPVPKSRPAPAAPRGRWPRAPAT
jgi:phage terminase large subunit GpA-like protein